ncbi:DUF7662 domain-containing protein [Phenylobacterium sp.]|uniref:DUF7662 domain-containing protein n=1 Tax=Phenylobacterium sp. TaxID=1871053 RepID=UPI002D01BDE0|nr:hypothetical protein [Phenylobacterium sp.]HVI33407.1 hypothetical protein [Phenylobacterium sp.]
MSKYSPLSDRLAGHPANEWQASFAEIEEVLGFPLPKTARTGKSWWSGMDKPHARAWTAHGFEADVDHARSLVTFRRSEVSPAAVEAVLPPVGEIAPERLEASAPPPATTQAPAAASDDARRQRTLGMAALAAGGVAVVAGLGALLMKGLGRRDRA